MQRKEAKKILVLDFDGVIVDSMNEGLFSSWNTYIDLNPGSKIFGGKKFEFGSFRHSIKKCSSYIKFKTLRAYLKSADDYYCILCSIDRGIRVSNSKEYSKFASGVEFDSKKFIELFYANRAGYIRESFSKWIMLTPLFPHMKEVLQSNDAYISTSNRKSVVIKTLGFFGIRMESSRVFDNADSLDKREHLARIKDMENAEYKDMIMVDDQVGNLIKIKQLGAECMLALWGYNNAEQRNEAKSQGIRLLDAKSIAALNG